jgi:hypothetical protein
VPVAKDEVTGGVRHAHGKRMRGSRPRMTRIKQDEENSGGIFPERIAGEAVAFLEDEVDLVLRFGAGTGGVSRSGAMVFAADVLRWRASPAGEPGVWLVAAACRGRA